MQREADTFISNNERDFIRGAIDVGCRLDGRGVYDFRKAKFEFSLDDSSASLQLGSTRVTAVISASLEAPFPDRPSEGNIRFNVECGPMASPAFEPGRPGPLAIQLARLVERALKQSGAVDAEALCVIAGRKVWSLRCDVHVLDHGGNLIDACILAALAAFMAYRKPEVTVGGETGTEIIIHPREQREPLPLTIHHFPVGVTWALFELPKSQFTCAVDPSLKEEAAQDGSATFIVNTNKEVCGTHKAEGIGITANEMMRLVRLSCEHAETLLKVLKAALDAHDVARVAARVRRADIVPGLPPPSRHVSISGKQGAAGTTQQPESDIDMGSSSDEEESEDESEEDTTTSEEEEDEEEESSEAMEQETKQDIPAPTAPTNGQQKQSTRQDKLKGGPSSTKPRLTGSLLGVARPGTPSNEKASSDGTAKKSRPTPKQTSSPVPMKGVEAHLLDDNLEAIASLIAGKTTASRDEEADLATAIKQENVKKKQKKARA